MPGQNDGSATTPAQSGAIDMKALSDAIAGAVSTAVAKAVGEAMKPISEAVGKAKEEGAKKETSAALTEERLQAILEERDKSRSTSERKTAARQKVADELRAKGVADELITVHLPDTDDADALKAASEKIVTRFNEVTKVKGADLGGASKDGGKTPGQGGDVKPGAGTGLSPGVAKFAESIKLPSNN